MLFIIVAWWKFINEKEIVKGSGDATHCYELQTQMQVHEIPTTVEVPYACRSYWKKWAQ